MFLLIHASDADLARSLIAMVMVHLPPLSMFGYLERLSSLLQCKQIHSRKQRRARRLQRDVWMVATLDSVKSQHYSSTNSTNDVECHWFGISCGQ